jgi:drug/metabolite transporter (DMT)-like permease
LFFNIDTLRKNEAIAMSIIIVGVLCSTVGNAHEQEEQQVAEENDDNNSNVDTMTIRQSVQTSTIAVVANLCFALRVMCQKRFREHPNGKHMTDTNMLMWMQRFGSVAVAVPMLVFNFDYISDTFRRTLLQQEISIQHTVWMDIVPYWSVVVMNAACFSLYALTNTAVLTKVSVGQHTGLNALRRVFVIVFTAVVFGVPITFMNGLGIVLCFSGFSAFSYYRHQNNIMGGTTSTQSGILPIQKDGIDVEIQLPMIASSSSSSSPPPPSSSPTGLKNHSNISKTWIRTFLPFGNHNDIHEHGT